MSQKIIPIIPQPEEQRIYARSVKGWFTNWRWVMVWVTQLLYYGLPWLSWDGRQAVLFDLSVRRFHIFGLTFTPHDLILLTLLLAVSALALFLFTAVAGRLWCGYTCPQTVYSEIFSWIERRIEGDRNERLRRDRGPRNLNFYTHKLAKHGLWILFAFWTGFTFVGYFTPIRQLGLDVLDFNTGPWATFWILFYGGATYGNAGWLREKVCKYMCPYARFQGVMFDQDTLTVSYDAQRGEPRGSRPRSANPAELGLGDCIDCKLCVQVCPVGIDIRDGLQYECIDCGACIDACNDVMDRMGYDRGLIRYGTESGLSLKDSAGKIVRRLFRPRVVVYTFLLWALIAVFVGGIVTHSPIRADVMRDRAVMMRTTENGEVENLYQAHLINTTSQPLKLEINVSGILGISVPEDERYVTVDSQSNRIVVLHARLPYGHQVSPGTHPIQFTFSEVRDGGATVTADSSFILR